MPCTSNGYRIFLGMIWLAWVIYAFAFAPQQEIADMDYIMKMARMETEHIDASVIALFNLMGVWPMIMAAILLIDGRGQRIPAWPFLLGSCVLGNFILFPYLLLRKNNPHFDGNKTLGVRFAESKLFVTVITLMACFMIAMALSQGSIEAFVAAFEVNNLVNIMSFDFILFLFAFPAILGDDMSRRGMTDTRQFWLYSLPPVLGPCLYLVVRPRLQ
jgi:hypothetical protein